MYYTVLWDALERDTLDGIDEYQSRMGINFYHVEKHASLGSLGHSTMGISLDMEVEECMLVHIYPPFVIKSQTWRKRGALECSSIIAHFARKQECIIGISLTCDLGQQVSQDKAEWTTSWGHKQHWKDEEHSAAVWFFACCIPDSIYNVVLKLLQSWHFSVLDQGGARLHRQSALD